MNNVRIEKKFVLGTFKRNNLEKILLMNGFIKSFPSRFISSIYLDTLDFDFAKDNINGVSKRKKIRFRWYNDDYNNIFLEEKKKQNFLVEKDVDKIDTIVSRENLLKNLKDYFYGLKNRYNNFNYRFVLKTNYFRSYWISDNKKIRATIDTNIIASPIKDLNRKLDLNETILEFKFLDNNESFFRDYLFEKKFNLRSQKYSKYLQCFNVLEDSSLIN